MLGVGIDWAESFHDVALGLPGDGIVQQFRIDHTAAGVERLITRCLKLESDPADVRVVLETRHGVLVEALVDAGFTVLPVNPDLVARRRGPAKKKDDAEDARICCLLALDQFLELRKLIPHGDLAGELRSIARDDERAARDQWRLLNRLRADLLATFPAALAITGDDLGSPVMLKLLATWPTHTQLADADADALESFARTAKHGWPARFAARDTDALAAPQLPVRDYLIRAKATTIALTAGTAPVTRRSGRNELVIARRLAHNRYLAAAVHQWAFCTLTTSIWAREFYDTKIKAGKAHHSALRALANRWLESCGTASPRTSTTTRPFTFATEPSPLRQLPLPEVDRRCLMTRPPPTRPVTGGSAASIDPRSRHGTHRHRHVAISQREFLRTRHVRTAVRKPPLAAPGSGRP